MTIVFGNFAVGALAGGPTGLYYSFSYKRGGPRGRGIEAPDHP